MSGIVNRPAAIQFGSNRRPVPSSPNEVRTEDDGVFNIEDMEGITPPPTPNGGIEPLTHLTPQRPLADDGVGTTPPSALSGNADSFNLLDYINNFNPFNSLETAESPLQRGLADDGVGTTPPSTLSGAADSFSILESPNDSDAFNLFDYFNNLNPFNSLETAEIFRRTPPPSPDGSLPLMPVNLDESSFSNLHSPQETQRPRLMPRPTALHPFRNLAELFALNQPSESQNSRPSTPNSLPDQNPQNQPD